MNTKDFEMLFCANWDLQQSQSALIFLLEDYDYKEDLTRVQLRRLRSFEDKSVISFFKAFNDAPGGVVRKYTRIKLTSEEKLLSNKIARVRNKIVAHTDHDFTHFRVDAIEVLDDMYFPIQVFDEGLNFSWREVVDLQNLIGKLMQGIVRVILKEIQENPERRTHYKKPSG